MSTKSVVKTVIFLIAAFALVFSTFLYSPSGKDIGTAWGYPIHTSLPPVPSPTPMVTPTVIHGSYPPNGWINVFVYYQNNHTYVGNVALTCSNTMDQYAEEWDDDLTFPGTTGRELVIYIKSGNGVAPLPGSLWVSQYSWVFSNGPATFNDVMWQWNNLANPGGDVNAPNFWVVVRFSSYTLGSWDYISYPCGRDYFVPMITK